MGKIMNFVLKWKRPTNIPFPNTWRRFEAKSSSGKSFKIRVQDLTPNRYEEAWEYYAKYFWTEEPIAKALKMTEDANLMADIKDMYYKVMEQNVSLMAVLDEAENEAKMVGLSLLVAHTKEDVCRVRLEGDKARRYEAMQDALRDGINVFEKLDTDVYFDDYGTFVHPEFRGCHIALNMILSITELGKVYGIRGKTVTLSNMNMRSVAQKDGFETFREIVYDEFRDENGDVIVPVKEFTCIRYGGIKFK